jgi:hypothetical protein
VGAPLLPFQLEHEQQRTLQLVMQKNTVSTIWSEPVDWSIHPFFLVPVEQETLAKLETTMIYTRTEMYPSGGRVDRSKWQKQEVEDATRPCCRPS